MSEPRFEGPVKGPSAWESFTGGVEKAAKGFVKKAKAAGRKIQPGAKAAKSGMTEAAKGAFKKEKTTEETPAGKMEKRASKVAGPDTTENVATDVLETKGESGKPREMRRGAAGFDYTGGVGGRYTRPEPAREGQELTPAQRQQQQRLAADFAQRKGLPSVKREEERASAGVNVPPPIVPRMRKEASVMREERPVEEEASESAVKEKSGFKGKMKEAGAGISKAGAKVVERFRGLMKGGKPQDAMQELESRIVSNRVRLAELVNERDSGAVWDQDSWNKEYNQLSRETRDLEQMQAHARTLGTERKEAAPAKTKVGGNRLEAFRSGVSKFFSDFGKALKGLPEAIRRLPETIKVERDFRNLTGQLKNLTPEDKMEIISDAIVVLKENIKQWTHGLEKMPEFLLDKSATLQAKNIAEKLKGRLEKMEERLKAEEQKESDKGWAEVEEGDAYLAGVKERMAKLERGEDVEVKKGRFEGVKENVGAWFKKATPNFGGLAERLAKMRGPDTEKVAEERFVRITSGYAELSPDDVKARVQDDIQGFKICRFIIKKGLGEKDVVAATLKEFKLDDTAENRGYVTGLISFAQNEMSKSSLKDPKLILKTLSQVIKKLEKYQSELEKGEGGEVKKGRFQTALDNIKSFFGRTKKQLSAEEAFQQFKKEIDRETPENRPQAVAGAIIGLQMTEAITQEVLAGRSSEEIVEEAFPGLSEQQKREVIIRVDDAKAKVDANRKQTIQELQVLRQLIQKLENYQRELTEEV